MKRDRGPEEFFEVFREVQAGKKKGPDDQPAPEASEQAAAEEPTPEPEAFAPAGPPPSLTVSYPVAGAVLVGALLLIVAAYLLGKQAGWRAYEDAVKKAREERAARPGTGTPVGGSPVLAEPEIVDGRVFTLITYGSSASNRELAEAEAAYLNQYEPFRALGVQAHMYRDRKGVYRLCARGLAARSPAEREAVKAEIRRLKSRRKQFDYKDADFYAP